MYICGITFLNQMISIMSNNAFRTLMGFNAQCKAMNIIVRNNIFNEMKVYLKFVKMFGRV